MNERSRLAGSPAGFIAASWKGPTSYFPAAAEIAGQRLNRLANAAAGVTRSLLGGGGGGGGILLDRIDYPCILFQFHLLRRGTVTVRDADADAEQRSLMLPIVAGCFLRVE